MKHALFAQPIGSGCPVVAKGEFGVFGGHGGGGEFEDGQADPARVHLLEHRAHGFAGCVPRQLDARDLVVGEVAEHLFLHLVEELECASEGVLLGSGVPVSRVIGSPTSRGSLPAQ